MKRDEIENPTKQMSAAEKLSYFQRLITKYDSKKYFINQYLEADGHELNGKFFSPRSSSRLAFELYSFLATKPGIKHFQFEKKLPGINRSQWVPNMDVYFEKDKNIYFIESKYTEISSNNAETIPDAYYVDGGAVSQRDGQPLKTTLYDRFYGNREVADIFSAFVKKVQSECTSQTVWFDIKQEVTHLFGIVFYIINNKTSIKRKKIDNIKFYNIVYKFDDFEEDDSHIHFIKLANDMIDEIKKTKLLKSLNFSFEYKVKTIQDDVLPLISQDQKAFGTDRTVFDMLAQFQISCPPESSSNNKKDFDL